MMISFQTFLSITHGAERFQPQYASGIVFVVFPVFDHYVRRIQNKLGAEHTDSNYCAASTCTQ